jgi:hypothetical protein
LAHFADATLRNNSRTNPDFTTLSDDPRFIALVGE